MAEPTPSEHALDVPPEIPPQLHYNHIITNPLGATDRDLNREKVEFAPSTLLEASELPAPVASPPLAPLPNTSSQVSASSGNGLSPRLLSPPLLFPSLCSSPPSTSSLCFQNISYSVPIRRHPLAFLPVIPSLGSSTTRSSTAGNAPTDAPAHTPRRSHAAHNHNQQSGKQQQLPQYHHHQQRRSILQGISGSAKAGQVTAIMGASGSGKTTLLDILSHRISLPSTPHQMPSAPEPLPTPSASPPPDIPPSIAALPTPTTALPPSITRNGAPVTPLSSSTPALSPSITLNGAPVTASTMRRVSAYVMQDDLLFPALTVRETLLFAAELRLGNGRVGRRVKEEKVEGLMRLLGLSRVADSRIGDENRRHDCMWEEKVGRTGMCGVMQDDLLLPALTVRETLLFAAELRLGNGRAGLRAKEAKVEGLMRLLGLTRMADSRIGDGNRRYVKRGSLYPFLALTVICPSSLFRGLPGGEGKRVAIGVEMVGDPSLLSHPVRVTTCHISLTPTLFSSTLSSPQGCVWRRAQEGGNTGGDGGSPHTAASSNHERNIFVRETTHNAYRPSTYLLASTLVYLPLHLLMSLAITLEAWWCLSLTGGAAGLAFMVLVCFCCLFTGNAIATFVSATVNNVILAYAVVITVLANFALVCGFYIERASIPSYWLWLHYISPLKYAYEALALNEFDRVTSLCYLSARDIYSSTPLSVLLDEVDVQRSLVALRPALIGSPFAEVSTSTCLQTGPELAAFYLGLTQLDKWQCVTILLSIGLVLRFAHFLLLTRLCRSTRH
ncbi:unnamed protein product [Closterium sp. NIES-54]